MRHLLGFARRRGLDEATVREIYEVDAGMTPQVVCSRPACRQGAPRSLACNSVNTARGISTAIIWPSGVAKRTSTVSPPSMSPTPVRDLTATARGEGVSSAIDRSLEALTARAVQQSYQNPITLGCP
ncbi:hypothetical protein C0214_21345 [Methylobacterium sp. DM1]|nr:hypothetical protein C0214_21345 [Methylobacterium sp. DM1]